MLSFIVPARSQPEETNGCLHSILRAVRALRVEHLCEFICLDDNSEQRYGLMTVFNAFRQSTASPVTIARFRKHQHYTGVFAYGLSKAKGEKVFFISNDMVITPTWLQAVLGVSALDSTFGIVRGTADLVDSHPEHSIMPPFEPITSEQIDAFGNFIYQNFGLSHTVDPLLSGDAVLVTRALIDAIGVMDKRFFGYFSDIDYGVRAMRMGFKLACAKGAWLRHYGAGHIRADRETTPAGQEDPFVKRMAMVQTAFSAFRLKWDMTLPEQYRGDMPLHFDNALKAKKPKGFEFTAPIKDDQAGVDFY